jgi:hypothetical protein
MGSLLGGGGCPVEGGRGALPSLPWWKEGSVLLVPYHLPLWRGVIGYTRSALMIRADPGTSCMLLVGPGPSLLLYWTRSNETSSEGDTPTKARK